MGSLLSITLESGPLPFTVFGLAVGALVALGSKRPLRIWLPVQLLGAVVGFGLGSLLAWLISDVWNSFDVALSGATRLWFGVGFAGIGFALAGLRRSRARRKTLAVTSVFLFALAGGIGVNADTGEFPTLGSAFGVGAIPKLALPTSTSTSTPKPGPTSTATRSLAESWHAPAGMPTAGTVGSVTIPATISHFAARSAIVYLPPAALVPHPPRLPVLELLSGQPGGPTDLITSGALASIANDFADSHAGLAPIVVSPDQLGAPQNNPMCVDSALGNSASYLTVDVPNWINGHLHVLSGPASWAIGGFSQGGTCSIQLGAKYPTLYGSILDISGQLTPHRGSVSATVAAGFHGSAAEYAAAAPTALLTAGAPYPDTLAIFIVGQADTRFGQASVVLSAAARAAGMTVHYEQSPGTAHDWHTVQFALRRAIPILSAKWGLS